MNMKMSSAKLPPFDLGLNVLTQKEYLAKHKKLPLHVIDSVRLNKAIWTFKAISTFRPSQNGTHFLIDTFKCISVNENVLIFLKISLKFVPKVQIYNIPSLV